MSHLHLKSLITIGKDALFCPNSYYTKSVGLRKTTHYGKTTTDFNMVFKQQINIVDSTFARHRNWMGSKHMDGQYFTDGLRTGYSLREGDLPGGVQA